jgi:hypothetical protein
MTLLRRLCVLALALTATGRAQDASLVIRTDRECRLTIDGQPRGVVKPGVGLPVNLSPGEHRVEAVPAPEGIRWEGPATATQAGQQDFSIPMQTAVSRVEAQRRGYWVAPDTGIIWAAKDNASGVSWTQASNYCRALSAGGYKDWMLPAIDDLQHFFGGDADQNGRHIAGPIVLTGWAWSASPGREPGERWAFDFGDGGRASAVMGDSGLNRALCMRRPKN